MHFFEWNYKPVTRNGYDKIFASKSKLVFSMFRGKGYKFGKY